ncbi:hypothetical protein [Micromonospora sp. CA-111912]|uniref:hypothetical protein n=1 Tax=Micromonospora sp. CA-111912 TaxID=3239955 RepID=UPI003D8CC517
MTSPQPLRTCIQPAESPEASVEVPVGGRPAPASKTEALVAAIFTSLAWLGAACGGWLMRLGRDMPEATLRVFGFLWLAAFAATALVLTVVMALVLRRRGLPRAALVAGSVAVTGIVATILFVLWV